MKNKLYYFLSTFSVILLCNWSYVQAQPSYITPGGTSNNNFPFNSTTSNKVQWVYTPSEFTPSLVAGFITHVYFRTANSQNTTKQFDDLLISLKHVNYATFSSGTFEPSVVASYGPTNTTINIGSDGWFGVELDTPFPYDGTSNLIVEATITNTNGMTISQNTTNGNKRIWGGRAATSGSTGTGQVACGLEIVTCSTAITKQPVDKTICETKNAEFEVQVDDAGDYQWQADEGSGFSDITNGGVYSGATSPKLKLTNVPFNMDGTKYRCLATKSSCADTSDEVTLTVNGLVKLVDMKPKDTTCISATKDLMVKGDGSITNYRWQIFINGHGYVDLPMTPPYSQTGNVLHITGVPDTLDGGRFRCIVDGICDTATSSEVQLTVSLIPYVAVSPDDVVAKHGQNVQFEVQATAPGARYFWQVAATNDTFVYINDGGIYSGTRTNRLTVKGVTKIQSDFKFRCVVASGVGCNAPGDTSNFAVLTVSPPASVANVAPSDVVLLYPNPVSGSDLFVKIGALDAKEQLSYRVVDKTGRTLITGAVQHGSKNISLGVGNLVADVYIFELRDESGRLHFAERFTKM